MKNIFTVTPQFQKLTKLFAVFMIVSVLMPSALFSSPSKASAQEADETPAVVRSESSSNSSGSSDSSSSDSSGGNSDSSNSNNSNGSDIPAVVTNERDAAAAEAAEKNSANESSGGGNGSNDSSTQLVNPPAGPTGSITFCTMIADLAGNIKTSTAGLPPGSFHIELVDATSTRDRNIVGESTIGTAQFQPFTPNESIILPGTDDAECKTFSNLPLNGIGYYYTQQTITGVAINSWQTPKYNDQYNVQVQNLNNFFPYSPELFDEVASNDDQRNLDADGYFVPLTTERPNRTLVILNRYNPENQAPVLSVLGPNPMTVLLGESYHELGAIATDDREDLTDRIVTTGTVNVNVVGRYEIVYTVTDRGNLSDTETRIVNVVSEMPNNLPPVISILGPNPMTVIRGESYHELGAAVTDDHDDLTDRIVITGTVDTATLGDYFITYTVRDNGDLTDTKVRTVHVVNDGSGSNNQPPVITILGDNPMTITVGGTFTDPGATATDDRDPAAEITARIVATGNVDTNTINTYTRIYTVTDSQDATDTKTRTVNVVAADNGGGGGGGNGGGGSSSGSRRRNNNNNNGQVLGATTGPQEACAFLTDYMHRDWQNDTYEVVKLQSFLKYFEGFTDLQPTGFFDQATFNAVTKFQERYSSEILAPWGHDAGTGFVYILTQKKINEIFCKQILSITAPQAQEIAEYRAFLANQKNNVLDNPSIETESSLKDIKDIVGEIFSTTTPTVIVDNSMGDTFTPAGMKAAASAIFSLPKDRGMLLQSLYFLLIALIAIYLLTEIIVGSMDTSTLTKYRVWSRKATSYLLGLILAIVVAVWYKVFSIVMPLLILAIVSGAFLAWAITKRSGDQVISLPPSNQ